MRRIPTVAATGALVLGLLVQAAPVAAQVDEETPPTTVVADPPADDPGSGGDAPTPKPLDPDEIPDRPEEAEDEGDDDTTHELVVGSAELATARLAELEEQLAAAESWVDDLRARRSLLDQLERDLSVLRGEAVRSLAQARSRRVNRAVGAYVRGGPPGLEAGLTTGANRVAEESQLLTTVLQADDVEVARRLARRLDLTARLSRVAEERASTIVQLRRARRAVIDRQDAVDSGEYAARIFAAGSEVAITGFVFPVGDPHEFIDSWGFPRAGGRSHEGSDIFAERGTPLVAVEDGVLARVGNDRLGGIKLWLVGESGTHYYYAHLERYAPGVTEGAAVDAGDVIGYVGDSGDAKGTPPHLHFQLHPGGGEPVNPFPLLQVVDEMEAARRAR
jgi:murein DD-endopeptidase MepM/ murein hydrolase activator NlpD